MKNGIGPQSLGAAGMSPNSKPCGTPLDFNEGFESLPEGVQRKIDPERKADSAVNSGTPLYFQDDLAAIQGAVSTLEKHNMTGGGGGAQPAAGDAAGAAASQKEMLMSSMQQGSQGGPGAATMRGIGGLFGRFAKRR